MIRKLIAIALLPNLLACPELHVVDLPNHAILNSQSMFSVQALETPAVISPESVLTEKSIVKRASLNREIEFLEPSGPLTNVHSSSRLLPLAATGSIVISALLGFLVRGSPTERLLQHQRAYQKKLQKDGEFPTFVDVRYAKGDVQTRSVQFAESWRDYRGVANAFLATEYRNRKNLSKKEIDFLNSALEFKEGETLETPNLQVRANRGFQLYIRDILEFNPWSLVARNSQGKVVGFVFCTLLSGSSVWDFPVKWLLMLHQHSKDIEMNQELGLASDGWFTGEDRETAEAMIDLSAMLVIALQNKPEWLIRLKRVVVPYSNVRGYPAYLEKHPGVDVEDYLLDVIDGKIKDPAISFHLGKGARIRRIIKGAHEIFGGGWGVLLEYDLDEIALAKKTGKILENFRDSREFVLKFKGQQGTAAAAAAASSATETSILEHRAA